MKVWTVYSVRNRVNGRAYIGVHKTEDPNDSYMGSGKLIRLAVAKHGSENFEKTVLAVFETPEEAFELEASLVTEDRLESGELYNLKVGGEGGWDFANKVRTPEHRLAAGKAGQEALKRLGRGVFAPGWRSLHAKKLAASSSNLLKCNWSGRKHSEATKAKMSASHQGKRAGAKNGQYGTMWITNGMESRKILRDEAIPEGWRQGRKMSTSAK